MEALDNKCPTCGATITFNPLNQLWDCQYCSSKFTLDELQKFNNASSAVANLVDQLMPDTTVDDLDVYRCRNCGAQIMADRTTTSTFCVYCGSVAILKERFHQGKAPNYIIPFKKVKEDAIKGFKKVTRGKLLTPKCFKDSKNIEKITGVYIPFWAYDLEANGEIEFEASDIETWSDSRYRYQKVHRYSVRKSGHFDFNKVLADASSRFPDSLMDSLEPFNFDDLKPYNHAYLSGFLAEKYDVDEKQGLSRVSGRSKDTAVSLMENTVGHQQRTIVNNGIRVSARYTHYILLPVWMVNIRYNKRIYTFAMNGQTGKMVGNIPVSIPKAIMWFLIFFILLFALGYIFVTKVA